MTVFGTELPERVEFLGVYFLINPATMLIAAVVLGLVVAALIFRLRQRAEEKSAYAKEFNFFGGVDSSAIESNGRLSDAGTAEMAQLKNGLVSIEEQVTEPIELPLIEQNAPTRQAYVKGDHRLPKAFGSD